MTYILRPGEETTIELPGPAVVQPPPAVTLNPSRGPRGPQGPPGPAGTDLLVVEYNEPLPSDITDSTIIVRNPQ